MYPLNRIRQILNAESLDNSLIISVKSFFPTTKRLTTIYPWRTDGR